jgi:hypothetical protein
MGPETTVETVTPEEFGLRDIGVGNTLVLGAPYIGKTERIDQIVASDSNIETTENLATTDRAKITIIDEFDRAWRTAVSSERNAFVDELADGDGICAVTRPYALDWLLRTEGSAITDKCLAGFDRILLLQYDVDDDVEREAAVKRCLEIGSTDTNAEQDDVSEIALRRQLDQLSYRYEFETEPLADTLGSYGASVVPPLVGYLSLSGVEEGLTSPGVVDACSELTENFALSEFLSETKDLALEVFSGDGGGAIAGALASSVPVGGAASLLLWAYLRDGSDDLEGEAILEALAGTGTTPTARADLEAELGLPPRTLEDLHWLLRDGGLAEVRQACEASPEQVKEFESVMAEHSARLDELEATVGRLEEEVEEFAGLYSEQLRNATVGLDAVGTQLANDEATLLDPLVDREDIDVDAIPYFPNGTEDENEIDDEGGREADDGPPQIADIAAAVRDEQMVVLRGPSGTGKTTAAYRVGRRLEAEEYTVEIPNLAGAAPETVKQALEWKSDSEGIVLYVSYRVGADETIVQHDDIQKLKEWVEEGVCDGIIVECRSELHGSLNEQFGEIESQSTTLRRETVEFSRFSGLRQAEGVVHWVADSVDAEEPDEERMTELIRLSEGNPEILKLAAKFEFSDDHSLDDVTTADGVVLKDLQNLYHRTSGQQQAYEQLFVLLSVTGGLTTAELCDLLEKPRSDLRRIAEQVRGYLNTPVREALSDERVPDDDVEWRLSPDIFADVTVRHSLSVDSGFDFSWAYECLFVDDRERSYDHYLFDIAQNLGVAYDALRRGEVHPERERMLDFVDDERCLDVVEKFLRRAVDDAEAGRFVEALIPLAFEGVPFDPDLLDERFDDVVDGAGSIERYDLEAGRVLQAVSGHLYGAHAVRGTRAEAIAGLAERFATECDERHGYVAAQFLSNVYSMAIKHLAEDSSPGEQAAWVDTLTDRAATAATDDQDVDNAALFLSNVYSMAIKHLADDYSPGEQADWVDTLTDAIDDCADAGPHEKTPVEFRATTHAFVVAQVTPEHPRFAAPWQQHLLELFLSEDDADHAVAFYSQYHLALTQLHDIDDWLPWLVADALERFGDDGPNVRPAADVLAEAARRVRYDHQYPSGLDSNLGRGVLGAVASVAIDDPAFYGTVISEAAEIIRDREPANRLAENFGVAPSDHGATVFVGHAYARVLRKVVDADGERLEPFHDRAVAAARGTPDPETALVTFYSRALPWFSADAVPKEVTEVHEWVLEAGLSHDDVNPVALYTEYLTRLANSGSHDPAWFSHLAVDAIERRVLEADTASLSDEHIDRTAVVVADALFKYDKEQGMSGDVPDQVTAAAERVRNEAPQTFARFADAVDHHLEADHDALLVALEWRTELNVD